MNSEAATHRAFKACDVRGVYPDDVDENLFAALGRALVALWPDGQRVLLAGDVRASTPSLVHALAASLAAGGARTTLVHPFPTPAAYLAGAELAADLTLVVTASHNPPRYNGLKVLHRGCPPSAEEWEALRRLTAGDSWVCPSAAGIVRDESADEWTARYLARLLQLTGETRPQRVVLDPGNGCLCGVAAEAMRRSGHEVWEINGKPDGRFAGRGADPTVPGALDGLAEAVPARGADLGVAFDGDGDRVAFVDERGRTLRPDAAASLLAFEALGRSGGGSLTLDIRLSPLLARELEAAGGRLAQSAPGHGFVRASMDAEGACFGAELSGHYYYAELGGDDGLYAALRMASLVAKRGPLGGLADALPRPVALREIRLPCTPETTARVYLALETALPARRPAGEAGGVLAELGDAWLLARASTTEPLISLCCEAPDRDRLREAVDQVEAILAPFGLSFRSVAASDPIWLE